jgi:hypothetical protein
MSYSDQVQVISSQPAFSTYLTPTTSRLPTTTMLKKTAPTTNPQLKNHKEQSKPKIQPKTQTPKNSYVAQTSNNKQREKTIILQA